MKKGRVKVSQKQNTDVTLSKISSDKSQKPPQKSDSNRANFYSLGRLRSPTEIPLTPENILIFQRTVGNDAVDHLLQAKLKVGQPNDKYEQEADRVADQVMRIPDPNISAKTKKTSGRSSEVGPQIETNINTMKSGGQPLSETARTFFEPRFGADFSGVRVHTNTMANETAQAINAKAFTVGQNITFRSGQYAPESSDGKKLIAHELTHVMQQGKRSSSANIQRSPDNDQPKKIGSLKITYDSERRFVQDAEKKLNASGLAAGEILYRDKKKGLIGIGLSNSAFLVGPFSSDMGSFVYVYNFGSTGKNAIASLTKGTLLLGWEGFGTPDDVQKKFNEILKKYRSSGQTKQPPTEQAPTETGDQGGPADVTNLEQDMRDLLINWKSAAKSGAELFADRELAAAISKGGDWAGFLVTLLGNTMWAAAAFVPSGGPAFALSMAGIAVGSAPAIPTSPSKNPLPEVKKMCINHIQWAYDEMNSLLRGKAAALIKANPDGINRYPALAQFVQHSFRPGLYNKIILTHKKPPTLDKPAITAKYASVAKKMLDYYMAFQASGTSTYRGRYFVTDLAKAAYVGGRLAVLNYHGSGEMVTSQSAGGSGGGRGRSKATTVRTPRYYSKGVAITYVEDALKEPVLEIHRSKWGTEPRVFKDEAAARASWSS